MSYSVSLYYIKGINYTDTPYFKNRQLRDLFYLNHKVATIETSYYPPYYHNTIKFTTDDIDFNSNVNYLSIDSSDRTYYYFIDSFRYISDSIIELSITMDVIQTYYFDISISNCCIERKFINRYDDNLISRKYLRENVSQGVKLLDTKTYPITRGWYIIRYSKDVNSNPIFNYGGATKFPTASNYLIISSYFDYYCTSQTGFDKESVKEGGITNSHFGSDLTTLEYLLQSEYVANVTYVPFDIFEGKYEQKRKFTHATGNQETFYVFPDDKFTQLKIKDVYTTTDTSEGTSIRYNMYALSFYADPNAWTGGAGELKKYQAVNISMPWIKITDYTLTFEKNTKKGIVFDSKFVPALEDENYMELKFGENSALCSAKLFRSTITKFGLYALYEFDTGSRNYCINPFEVGFNNYPIQYQSIVSSYIPLDITLTTNALREYLDANKYKLLFGLFGSLL